ncbi:MAG: LysR family transcriptional regulator substrate-binding protein, partial [Oleibacter sp.]|nr:LysR family transcriptional regulator substrate-binding protein [Thalassolituus sp.]
DRHNRTISLTEAGIALLPKAQQILDLVTDTRMQLDNISGDIGGSLNLATSHHIGLHRLPPVLREFVQRYPNVDLNIEFMGSERAYQAVKMRQVDIALTTLDEHPEDDLAVQPLWRDSMVCVCAPTHRLVQKKQLTLIDLAAEPAILPEPDTITYQLVANIFADYGLTLKTTMPTNYLETIKMMVSVGLGWSLLPASMIDEQLHCLTWPSTEVERRLGLIYLHNRTLSNATQALIKLLN